MTAYNKFPQFTADLLGAKHNFESHNFHVMLTNTVPAPFAAVRANIVELFEHNGYLSGGVPMVMKLEQSGGIATVKGSNAAFTASGGPMGPFRYAVLYNATPPSAFSQPLVSWWDYGTEVTLLDTETFYVDVDAANGIFKVT